MLRYETGDILKSRADAIVNTVNCVGVMGRGIALQFKNAFPENFKAYKAACKAGQVQPGKMFIFKINPSISPRYIINFPTKRHWRGKSRMEDIDSGLIALADDVQQLGIQSIAIPPLGSGLGGLDWIDVRSRIEKAFRPLPGLEVVLFEPNNISVQTASTAVPIMTAGRAVLVLLMERYLRGLMDPFITLLELHKLMYFMQEAGEPLRLQYKKALYGPYAENLRHVLKAVEGHLISGYADGGDAPDKQLGLVPGSVKEAQAFLLNQPKTAARFERMSELVEGFETSFGLELLASVHWIVKHEAVSDIDDVIYKMHHWNKRKQDFSPYQINIAFDVLKKKGWFDPVYT